MQKDVRLTVKDITTDNRREKFTLAVESLAKAMKMPLTVKPREKERGEKFVYQAQADIVERWNMALGEMLDTVYLMLCKTLDLPVVTTFSKAIEGEPLTYRGRVVFNPETGQPINRKQFEDIIKAVEKFLNKRLDATGKKVVLDSVAAGRILARKLRDLPASEVRKLKLVDLDHKKKPADWISDNLKWLDDMHGGLRGEEKERMLAHYQGMERFVEVAEQSMGNRITKMQDTARYEIRDSIIHGVMERKGRKEVAQDLFNRFGAMNRDWQRIAESEIVESSNNAFLKETTAGAAAGERVYFRRVEMKDQFVCKFCEKIRGTVALWSDVPLADENIADPHAEVAIWEGKSNVGRKAADYWVPAGLAHPWCYSEDTEVLTDKGWLFFKELSGGEKIMSINPETKEVGYVGYVEKIEYRHNGKMIHFAGTNYDMLVTPNHNMLYTTQKLKKAGKLASCSAEELIKKSGYMLPMAIGKWEGCVSPERKLLGNTDVSYRDYVRLWAWFLSEGNTRRREVKFSQKRKSKILNNVPSIAPMLKDAADGVYLYGDSALEFVDFQGVHAEQKYVPDFIKQLSPDLIRDFIQSFNWGDGSFSVGGRSEKSFSENSSEMIIRTSSPRMMADLCELIVKAGWIPSVWHHKQKGKVIKFRNGEYAMNTDCYNINIKKSEYRHFASVPRVCRNGKPSRVPTVVDYDGMVYDVELEKWHFLLVKRNGKIGWSGNCRGSWERWIPPAKK